MTRDDDEPIRFFVLFRKMVARSGSDSMKNWFAARGSAHAIT